MPHETILQQILNAEQKFKENNYKGNSVCSYACKIG